MNAIIRTLTTVALGVALLAGSAGTAAAAAPTTDPHGPGTTGGTGTVTTGGTSTGGVAQARPRHIARKGSGLTNADCADIRTAWIQAVDEAQRAAAYGDELALAFWNARAAQRLAELKKNCVLVYA